MIRIALADRFFELMKCGTKTATTRYKHREYERGDGMFYSDTSDLIANIRINEVIYKKFGELTEEDARLDGFGSLADLKRELLGFYPMCQDEDEVTIVHFENVEQEVHHD